LTENIKPFLKIARQVKEMRPILKAFTGMRISCPESLFEIAIVSLLLQNTTIKRSIQMMTNLLNRYGDLVLFDDITLRIFFSPRHMLAVSEDELRKECRLGYRAKYLPEFAKFFSECDDDGLRDLNATTLMSTIENIKGVGPYTSGIIASHALRAPNALALDVWNTKLFIQFFSLDAALTRDEVAARWNRGSVRNRISLFA
jgi:3-methyladenine DNA glycosylase/8-oxoguanine DNA glycosylase